MLEVLPILPFSHSVAFLSNKGNVAQSREVQMNYDNNENNDVFFYGIKTRQVDGWKRKSSR